VKLADGTEVKVRHNRLYDDDTRLSMLPKGGNTVVEVFGGNGQVLATGESKCRPDENYNRRIGREIALGRALKQLGWR